MRCHRAQQGGGRPRSPRCGPIAPRWRCLRGLYQGRRVSLGHAQAQSQLGHRPGRSLPQRAQRRSQHHQEPVDPLMRFALAHPEQPPLYDLEGRGLQVDQEKQQTVLGRGQRTVLVGRVPSGDAWLAIETPKGHMGPKGRLKGRR